MILILYYYIRDLLKAVIVLLPLLGVTWIIGILAVSDDTQVFAWIFAVFNSLQVCTIYSRISLLLCELCNLGCISKD